MNQMYYYEVKSRWDALAKPIDGLGEFEELVCKMGAIQEDIKVPMDPAVLLVFCADNGIIEEGVSQSDDFVTYAVAKALGEGNSTANQMAKRENIDVIPVNVGIKREVDFPGIQNRLIKNGTNNFLKQPAMTEIEMIEAIEAGRATVAQMAEQGYKVILLGEMGIGNTTTSAAVLAALMGVPAKECCGRGAGLDDAGLARKIQVIDEAIAMYDLDHASPEEVLRTVGGLDIAAIAGAIMEASKRKIPVISDGLITGVAALLVRRMGVEAWEDVIFSHNGKETGIAAILEEFGTKAVIGGNMALGEGTGAIIFYSALKTAKALYDGAHVFADIAVDPYERKV